MQIILELDEREHATIIAALRYYQSQGMGDEKNRDPGIDIIATKSKFYSLFTN